MSVEALDHVFKILLIGDAGVGKSRYISFFLSSSISFLSSILYILIPLPPLHDPTFNFRVWCHNLSFFCSDFRSSQHPIYSILLQFTDGYFNDNLQSTIG